MTYNEAESVKDLAKPVVEALGRIMERECSECEGLGKIDAMKDNEEYLTACVITCPQCNGSGKVKWKWEPKVGQFCLWGQAVLLITDIDDYRLSVSGVEIIEEVNVNLVVPILHWEECFEVLFKAGFSAEMDYSTGHKAFCTIRRPGLVSTDFGSNPTEATYKAIIKLREEFGTGK